MALNADVQRRLTSLVAGNGGAVLQDWLSDELEQIKTALVSAPIERVQQLQGKAAAYTLLLSKITKGRE
jgi:hypothetical protein